MHRWAAGLNFDLSLHSPYFVYGAVKAQTRLHISAGSSEPLRLIDVINSKILCVGPYVYDTQKNKLAKMVILRTNKF